jgi:hypothetical protein
VGARRHRTVPQHYRPAHSHSHRLGT